MKVIRAIAFANGAPCPVAGQYVRNVDFEYNNGQGFVDFTDNPAKAMQFTDAGEALSFWRTQSQTVPLRPDGKPNRPLTATTVVIEDA